MPARVFDRFVQAVVPVQPDGYLSGAVVPSALVVTSIGLSNIFTKLDAPSRAAAAAAYAFRPRALLMRKGAE